MPVIVPPSAMKIPQGYRVAAHYQFVGSEFKVLSFLGTNTNGFEHDLDLTSIQVPANLQNIRSLLFSLVVNPSVVDNVELGTFYIVVDNLQALAFEIVRNQTAVVGDTQTSTTAIIPIQSSTNSILRFIISGISFTTTVSIADLYVNCFDFDVPPFVAQSHAAFVNPTFTISGTVPVDVVNTSMNVFVNNPTNLPVPVNQVP